VAVSRLATHFGDLELDIRSNRDGTVIDYRITVMPEGDQTTRPLERIILYPRVSDGRAIKRVTCDDQPLTAFTRDAVILTRPERYHTFRIQVQADR
jgi:hypothetical protein